MLACADGKVLQHTGYTQENKPSHSLMDKEGNWELEEGNTVCGELGTGPHRPEGHLLELGPTGGASLGNLGRLPLSPLLSPLAPALSKPFPTGLAAISF